MSEWSNGSTAVYPCKTSAFSQKYILNEIQSMTRAVLYKYTNCIVDKLRALALVTNYLTNYSIIIITTTTTTIVIIIIIIIIF